MPDIDFSASDLLPEDLEEAIGRYCHEVIDEANRIDDDISSKYSEPRSMRSNYKCAVKELSIKFGDSFHRIMH